MTANSFEFVEAVGKHLHLLTALFFMMATLPLILRMLLNAAYLAVAVFVLVEKPFQAPFFDWTFGLACMAYGLFRGVRAIKDFQAQTEEP